MWTRKLLKENGKIAFHRNFGSCVAVSALTALLSGGIAMGNPSSTMNIGANSTTYNNGSNGYYGDEWTAELFNQIPSVFFALFFMILAISLVIGLAVSVLVSNVATVGCCRYFLENREHKTSVGQMFYSFREGRYSTNVWIMFLRTVYIFGWSLLFWVPGIVKAYSYMLVPYILAENPSLNRKRVFELSSKMMYGHRWEAFVLGLSFLGWTFLGAFTGGIVTILYVNPYIHATNAEFYSALKAEAEMKGILEPGELPGVEIPEMV